MLIDASELDFRTLNERIREAKGDCFITGCLGQRFIGAGLSSGLIKIGGIPGNALGAYLNGAEIITEGDAQDAIGDTMNGGRIVVHGSAGDAVGYAMRGGDIYIRDSAGYRAGIHMKEYRAKVPVMVIGGCTGSFLGEYQAGGIIIVLGLNRGAKEIVGNFPCTGMHGGRMFLRCEPEELRLPGQVVTKRATEEDLAGIMPYLEEYCRLFDVELDSILGSGFTMITPDSKNPYKQMYVGN